MTMFNGARVLLLEARRSDEMASLVWRHGGTPVSAPALAEVPVDAPGIATIVDRLASGAFDIVVLLSGAGATRLLEESERTGRTTDVERSLSGATTICRGPKPTLVLKKRGVVPRYVVAPPNTTEQLLEILAELPLARRDALIVSAGEIFAEPSAFLTAHGARSTEVLLYRWDLSPTVRETLTVAIDDIVAGRVAAIAFTSQVQVRHLMEVARAAGLDDAVRRACAARVIVGAVGRTTARALREYSLEPRTIPDHPKMGHLVAALAVAVERGEAVHGRSVAPRPLPQ
ncbi:MAG TPA: uroporphyrinogen-III synthase [Gemmatimonadaceae bacterium]|jgi:uroporphyrinogen-III synthase|nr:uroporphyrinogen-III synthase [Gemmatimonadaceae bacterium]